jgi:hypothetical protein
VSRRPWEIKPGGAEALSVLSRSEIGNHDRGSSARSPAVRSAAQAINIMDAIRRFSDAHQILPFVEGQVGAEKVKRVASTNGGEWAGPCLLCGGEDRLRIWPTPNEGAPHAWCRQCKASGDALDWATRIAGRDPKVPGSIAATLREHGLLGSVHEPRAPSLARPTAPPPSSTAMPASLPSTARNTPPLPVATPKPARPTSRPQPWPDWNTAIPIEQVFWDQAGQPQFGCSTCGGREFARLENAGQWLCATCAPPERTSKVEMWTTPFGAAVRGAR